ncbi:MAG: hypothetical protein RML37_08095 [Chitinophagales bacterium]|nr:hypothetical protein [Chitinophagales bacterium]
MLNITKHNIRELLQRYSTSQLEEMVRRYPYFHQAHLLLAVKYQSEKDPRFDEQLQLAALYSQNREGLFELFVQRESPFVQTEISPKELTAYNPVEIQREITSDFKQEEKPLAEEVTPAAEINPAADTPPYENPEIDVQASDEQIADSTTAADTAAASSGDADNNIENQTQDFRQAPHTFEEWLQYFSGSKTGNTGHNASQTEITNTDADKELENLYAANINSEYLHELVKEETHYAKGLEEFIAEQIKKHKPSDSKLNVPDNDISPDMVTETLARIYEKQRKYQRAIKAYEVLALKYPAKSDLFAAQIERIKKLL